MFFWFPINTDAPVYYFPWATISLIAANCLVFLAGFTGYFPIEQWALHYGQISPVEWVTSNFVHFGIGHLLGNIFFLWSVGLIVEGKLGWPVFLLIYFGIGISQCALEQLCMLGSDGMSLGASSIVFGLTAISLVWAPKNEISFAWFFWIFFYIRAGVAELSVMTYSIFVFAFESIVFVLQGFHIGTSALHLMGAVIGYGIGVAMLKRGMVDCEGWDLFSVLKGTYGRVSVDPDSVTTGFFGPKRKRRRRDRHKSKMLSDSSGDLTSVAMEDEENRGLTQPERTRQKILKLLRSRKPGAAHVELQRYQHINPAFRLDAGPLRRLAQGLLERRQWEESVPLLEEYLERFEEDAALIRIQLATILIKKQRRPRAALRTIQPIDAEQVPEPLRVRLKQIRRSAADMIESGVIELSGQAFSTD